MHLLVLRIVLLLLFTSAAPLLWAQQPKYILQPRELRAALRQQYTQSATRMELGFKQNTVPTLSRYQADLTFQYGLSRRITLYLGLGLLEASATNRQVGAESGNQLSSGDQTVNIADQVLGASLLLVGTKTIQFSSFLRVGLPTGNTKRSSGLFTGDGEWDQAFGLQFIRSSVSQRFVLGLEAGYRNRSSGFASDFQYEAFAAAALGKRVWVQFKHSGNQTLYNTPYYRPDGSLIGGPIGLYANNVSFYTAEPSVNVKLGERWGLAGGFAYIITGENVYKALTPFVAVHWGISATTR